MNEGVESKSVLAFIALAIAVAAAHFFFVEKRRAVGLNLSHFTLE